MIEAATVTTVMRTLADPTRRAVFERIVISDDISVVELTRVTGVTQDAISQHVNSLKQAGLVAERPEGSNVYYHAQPEGIEPLIDWMRHYAALSHRGAFWRERFVNLTTFLNKIDP
ncbi:MAG: metalloregulator ArsR/SmtB family transcription factor [Pseudomonadota bacterium]